MIKPNLDAAKFPIGVCHVCGDKGANFHYNGYACQSCRVFFTRSLLRGKPFVCQFKKNCVINRTTRIDCPACRFQKCLTANMASHEVGRYKRQGGAVVPYRWKINIEINKIGHPVSLGSHFVNELGDICPAARYAQLLFSLEKMCSRGPRINILDLRVNIDVNLADILVYSQACSPRTAITWEEPLIVDEVTPFMVAHYCRSATLLSDFMADVPEINKLNITDRLKLGRYNLIDFVLLTIQYRMWEENIEDSWLFLNGIHFKPLKDVKEMPLLSQLSVEVKNFMEEHVRRRIEELQLTDYEYVLLKMIVLFQIPPDISEDGREIIRLARGRYSYILMELLKETNRKATEDEILQRLTKFMEIVPYIKTTSRRIGEVVSSLVLANVGGLRGALTYDIHFRQF